MGRAPDLEATNAAFGDAKDGFHFEVLGDTIFIAACLGLIAFGARTVNQNGSMADWVKGLLINDTWPALNDPSLGGGQRTMAAWCLLLGWRSTSTSASATADGLMLVFTRCSSL